MKISLVLPVYNEQDILDEVLANYKTDLKNVAEKLGGSYEIVAVNDGSDDATGNILGAVAKLNRNVRIVNLATRHGKQAAITAGMAHAMGDVVILADVTLLNPVGILEQIVTHHIEEGSAIVYAYRDFIGLEKIKHGISDSLVSIATRIFGVEGSYTGKANIMLYSRTVADVIVSLPHKNKMLRTMDNWTGFAIDSVSYSSGYSKSEISEKSANAKRLNKEQGHAPKPRSTAREHTSSTIYAITSAIVSIVFIAFWIVLGTATDVQIGLLWGIVMTIILLSLITISVLLFARSIMIKRLGIVYNKNDVIYEVESVIN